jgi:hypothetical protein
MEGSLQLRISRTCIIRRLNHENSGYCEGELCCIESAVGVENIGG